MPRSSPLSGTSSSSKVWDEFKPEADQAIKKRKLAAANAHKLYGPNSTEYRKAVANLQAMEDRNREDWIFRLQNEGLSASHEEIYYGVSTGDKVQQWLGGMGVQGKGSQDYKARRGLGHEQYQRVDPSTLTED
ncbi:hypothetical protein EVG20_g3331 [Dentipellis fragilis]|uniref:Uncharacterized protein n=1 Tax=Dentipellis fragilis TaxID=205917 RepID=A0A4Y9Z354_9AGAM|nr:hypothetical protein EVG20_g3331 [Dentipellis fragilis]